MASSKASHSVVIDFILAVEAAYSLLNDSKSSGVKLAASANLASREAP